MSNILPIPPRPMRGATPSIAGASGYAPAPAAGNDAYLLRGDGSWVVGLTDYQSVPITEIAAIGDSLTYGETSGGQNAEPWPKVLSSMLGVPVLNYGLQGYIPRHRVYDFLIDNAPTVLIGDLLTIPPTQYEDRVNQPAINNLRTFYADAQQKCVHVGQPSEQTAVLYEYSAASTATADGDNVLMPDWVGAGVNNPEYLTGRWIKQAGTFTLDATTNRLSDDMIVWLGANGMEAADTVAAIQMLLRNRGPRIGKYWVLTLPNRQPYDGDQSDIEDWAQWTGEVNAALRLNFPGRVIDIDGWLMGRGDIGAHGNYFLQDANDESDVALYGVGIMPQSVRDAPTGSHFSTAGYAEIAGFVAQRISQETGYEAAPPVPLTGFTRFFQARGSVSTRYDRRVTTVPTYAGLSTGARLVPISAAVAAPRLIRDENGYLAFRFASGEGIQNEYANVQSGARTMVLHVRLLDAAPTTRADVIDSISTSQRNLLRVFDYSGTKRWSIYSLSDGDTGVVADTDWHCIIAVFNGASSYFYIDGVKSSAIDTGGVNGQSGPKVGGSAAFPAEFDLHEIGDYAGAADDAWAAAYWAAVQARYPLCHP